MSLVRVRLPSASPLMILVPRGGTGPSQEAAQDELDASMAKASDAFALAVRVATGDGGPDRTYRFHRDTMFDPRHMVMFQHVEGARVCEVSAAATGTKSKLVAFNNDVTQ